MTYWEQCEARCRPLAMTLWKRLGGHVTLEESEDMIRSMFVRCAKYAGLPEDERNKLLNRAMITEAAGWKRKLSTVAKYAPVAFEWGREREVHDDYCFILHELRQAGTPEVPYRIGQLVLYGYEVKEVKSILYLSRHHWEVNQRALRPYLAHVLQG